MLFSPSLPETRFDLHFSLARVPIRVHPLFWVMTVLFGAASGNIWQLLIWVVAVFVSIVIHELGHAFVMKMFGQPSRILLYLGGGLTIPEPVHWGNRWINVSLKPAQEILIALAGPVAGFLFALLIILGGAAAGGLVMMTPLFGIIPFPTVYLLSSGTLVNSIISTFIWVNIFWGFINLMPVYPLDGGNVARSLFIQFDPRDGLQKSLWVSFIAGCVVGVVGIFLFHNAYLTLLFGLLAFQSYMTLKGRTSNLF